MVLGLRFTYLGLAGRACRNGKKMETSILFGFRVLGLFGLRVWGYLGLGFGDKGLGLFGNDILQGCFWL